MKKKLSVIILSLVCAVFCAFGLTACDSGDKPSGDNLSVAGKTFVFDSIEIVCGEEMAEYAEQLKANTEKQMKNDYITFGAGGICSVVSNGDITNGNYTQNGSTVTMTTNGQTRDITVTENSILITNTDQDVTVTIIYVKGTPKTPSTPEKPSNPTEQHEKTIYISHEAESYILDVYLCTDIIDEEKQLICGKIFAGEDYVKKDQPVGQLDYEYRNINKFEEIYANYELLEILAEYGTPKQPDDPTRPDDPKGGLSYSAITENGEVVAYSVTGFDGAEPTNVVVPSVYNGKSVTSIAGYAFYGCSSLTSISIPDSVTTIGSSAFRNCSSLTSVTIPDGVTTIGSFAFYNCSSLTSVTIPDGVTTIDSFAFYNCSSLTSISIPDGITTIGEEAFEGCSNLKYNEYDNALYLGNESNKYLVLVKAKSNVITSCQINGNTKIIYNFAFGDCSDLADITIPDGVTSIAGYAFRNCNSLTSISIPDGVTTIEGYTFAYCSKLTSVTIPDGVTTIGSSAFRNCSSLTSISIPDGVTAIGEDAFSGCSNLKYNEYDNALYLGNETNKYLVLVKAKSNVITSCQINGNTKIIYYFAFKYCSDLKDITIPDGVTTIGGEAFKSCRSLTSITIPDSVTTIGYEAFSYCTDLTSITIPDSVTRIGEHAFMGCSSLTNVNLPNGVVSTGNLFYGCSSLISFTIPNKVWIINDSAFYECISLTNIIIPDSVETVLEYAFYNCNSLKTIYYGGTAEDWAEISIGDYNSSLTSATRYYYSENKPTTDGNYWHYDTDGVTPVIWTE